MKFIILLKFTAVLEDNFIHLRELISYFQKSLSIFEPLTSGDSMK